MTDNNKNNVLKETEDYMLVVGESPDKDYDKCYLVINKKTDVTEVDTRLLPQAYAFVEQLQANIDGYREASSAIDTGPNVKNAMANLSKIKFH